MEKEGRERIVWQRREKRRRDNLILKTLIAFLLLLMILFALILVKAGWIDGGFVRTFGSRSIRRGTPSAADTRGEELLTEAQEPDEQELLLSQAELYAMQYDYDAAIELLQSDPDFYLSEKLQTAANRYTSLKNACVACDVTTIPHVFFHSLIYDPKLAFDGDEDEAGYNQYMATVPEFRAILQEMYDRGYVMVSLHDMCQVGEDGSVSRGEIRLPQGRKPFVLSQDDVSYYHYMDGDGFASRLIVDENGRVKNEYIEKDGSVSVGDYDMVPIVDSFVEEHPDFAYHGHKGIIALTGYEGVLGYRTDGVYKTREEDRLTSYQKEFLEDHPEFDFDQEVVQAKAVADAMKRDGWEFASHTWGHINPLAYGYESVVRDTKWYKEWIEPIIGPTDVIIFAFGADIQDWQPYTSDNPYYVFFKEQGFHIYCNVDSSKPYWVQFSDESMRCGRRSIDGYAMYYRPSSLEDLFEVDQVWDDSRTVPVPEL